MLPTHRPHFSSLKADGTGYPFDNLQNSAIPANTPIYVAHVAKDKSWVLVDSHYGSGWLPARDIAAVDQNLIAIWEHSRHIAITRDNIPVYDEEGTFLFKTDLGAQFPKLDEDEEIHRRAGFPTRPSQPFPKLDEDEDNYRIMVVRADEHRTAQLTRGNHPKEGCGPAAHEPDPGQPRRNGK